MPVDPLAPNRARPVEPAARATLDGGPHEPWPDFASVAVARDVLGEGADDPTLRAVLDLVMVSPVPMAYAHGARHRLLFNAAYATFLTQDPRDAYGRPAAEVWAEAWDLPGVGDRVRHVYATGETFYEADTLLPLLPDRSGGRREGRFTRGYLPVRDGDGAVSGMLTVAVETTGTAHAVDLLGRFSAALASAATLDDVARLVLRFGTGLLGADYVRLCVIGPGEVPVTVRGLVDEAPDESPDPLPPLWHALPPVPAAAWRAVVDGATLAGDEARDWLLAVLDRRADRVDRDQRELQVLPLVTDRDPDGEEGVGDAAAAGERGGHRRPRHRLLGALVVGHDGPVALAEQLLLTGCVHVLVRAVQRARRLEEERSVAQVLQRSLLPDTLPQPERMLLTGRYEPAPGTTDVGGDFYDAFEVSEDRVALVIGDAMGHGVVAASVMGQVRTAVRAAALTDPAPASVLAASSALLRSLEASSDAFSAGFFVTVTYVLVDPRTGTACTASAGHAPPLVRRAGEATAEWVDVRPGPPLGVAAPVGPSEDQHPATDFELGVGDLLLLVTDGLVERRHESLTTSMARLAEEVGAAPGDDPFRLCSDLIDRYARTSGDDVAVLAATRTGSAYRSARTTLPTEHTAVRAARAWVDACLDSWGVPARRDDVLLAVSELVTNAVVHARTSSELSVRLGEGRLLVTVADHGTKGRAVARDVPDEATRGRGLRLVAELADAWGSQRTSSGQRVWFEVTV
ncbi:SpoIIE family protein phosphatase [Aquipuribacter sp. SD81]|uniref:SpoIIE family protein phosphatase n=1 Tax=Aquipuribacter sp. SD81 TaxID=3127703 RepID=UPI003019FAF1